MKDLPKPFTALAPMDDVTDTVFRQMVALRAKPDLFFTEFVNVDGLQSPGRSRLIHKLQFSDIEKPIFVQIWGKNPENYLKTASELVELGFAGIDINMGCPDKKVIKNGCCAALINNRPLAAEIIAAVKEGAAGKIPVSVKLRTGFDTVDLTWSQFVLDQKIDMLTVHGRTVRELSKVPCRWPDIASVRQYRDQIAAPTLIVGNGDVGSRQQAEKLAAKYRLDGIMIGRAIFSDPYIFAEQSQWQDMERTEKISLYKKHIELFVKTWQEHPKNFQGLKKFAKVYLNGFSNAANVRSDLVRSQSLPAMLSVLDKALQEQ